MKKLILITTLLLLTLSNSAINAETLGSNTTKVEKTQTQGQQVVFNTKTKKVHKLTCPSAASCKVNCIKINSTDAYNRGGVPCKKCGG